MQKNEKFHIAALQLFLRWSSESAELRSSVIGAIDPPRVVHHLEDKSLSFLFNIMKALMESRIIEFHYLPQTDQTIQKLRKHKDSKIKVRMLPHRLIFSGSDFNLLGETYFSDEDIRERQYSMKGLSNFSAKEVSIKKLAINPEKLYRYTISVWINGELYDLEIEEKQPSGAWQKRNIKVNGEVEILSYAASKLGNLKILNPPPALLAKARETPGLCEIIFKKEM